MALYSEPKSLLQARLKETLQPSEEVVISDLMQLALLKKASVDSSLLVYSEIYKLLGLEKFTELVNLLDGRALQLPDREDFKDTLLLIICYYYKEQGKTWDEIKEILGGTEINTIKVGIQMSQYEKFLKKMIGRMEQQK